jgi:hypothetical protein
VFQEGTAVNQEKVPYVKSRYNQNYVHTRMNGYGDNGEIRFKE